MKNPCHRLFYVLIFAGCYLPVLSSAQPVDSVVVTGRIRNLSARLYREASTVLVSRNNILQASRELVRPAPLNVDGTFRVSLPLIYPQEELYFNYGRISTAFLASPGTLSIELDADSLFTAVTPFRFGGVNAQVNGQFARYKAFEATYPNKPDGKKLTDQISDQSNTVAFGTLSAAYQEPFGKFAARDKPFPLLSRWVQSVNRYNASAFLYDKATYENEKLPVSLTDSLRPPDDLLLTAARASAMNRFANYVTQRVSTDASNGANSLTVRTLSLLLERYGKNLTAEERLRLNDYATKNTARAADLRFFDGLVKRSPDTLQRLINYETLIQRSIRQFDSTAVNYLSAYWLANQLPGLTLDFARLLYDYARPQVKDPQLVQSLDELYQLEVKDSTRVRAAMQTLRTAGARTSSLEISPGIFITRDDLASGANLFDQVVNTNRGKVVYLLLMSATDEAGRQAALDAQRLRSVYSSRDLALVYLPLPGTDKSLWPELATRYNLSGDHLLLVDDQLLSVLMRLRSDSELAATVINRTGKVVKRNAPLPDEFEELRKVLDKNL